MNMCLQSKRCTQMVFTNTNYLNDAQMIWWTGLEMVMNGSVTMTYMIFKIFSWILYLMVQFAGVTVIACAFSLHWQDR